MSDSLILQLSQVISKRFGLQLRDREQKHLWETVLKRSNALNLPSPHVYVQHLIHNNSDLATREWQELIKLLTIPESYFFRDQGQFSLLKTQILPELIHRKRSQAGKYHSGLQQSNLSLRIWSAGCSTGEEAYSLAILLYELIPDLAKWNLSIIGTDINPLVVERASQGIYSDWSFRMMSPEVQQNYFRRTNKGWEIAAPLRQFVTFRCENLLASTSTERLQNLDLIICRNVFIYFNFEAIAQTLDYFSSVLAPHGYLITGHTELFGQKMQSFQAYTDSKSSLYWKKKTTAFHGSANSGTNLSSFEKSIPKSQDNTPSRQEIVLKSILETEAQKTLSANASYRKQEIQVTLEKINQLMDSKVYLEVIKLCKQIIQQIPHYDKAYYLLAKAHANLGNHQQATEACTQASQLNPLALEPYYLQAQIAEEQGNLERALEWLKRVIFLAPESIFAHLELGSVYYRLGNLDKARKSWIWASQLLRHCSKEELVDVQQQLTVSELEAFLEQRLQQQR